MSDYFRAVTLGAFTWKNEERIALLLENIRKAGNSWLLLHFILITSCLGFPVTFSIARLSPFELYNRLYGEFFLHALPDSAREALLSGDELNETAVEDFNMLMYESGYGRNVFLPLLGIACGLVLIIQLVFYLSAVFFVGLSRLNVKPLSFRDRMGIALYSSTGPVLAASLFGFYLPTVHIIIFYFMVMFFMFQRSKLCPDESI